MRNKTRLRLVAVLVLCIALVLFGRWERDRAGSRAVEGIAAVRAVVGDPLASREAEAFLRLDRLTCFLYTRGVRPLGVSLCYDDKGRLVEATDARDGEPRVWTVRMDRALARERVAPRRVDAVIQALSFRAILNAVRTTAVFSVSQYCLSRLEPLNNGAENPMLPEWSGSALAGCRRTIASIRDLEAAHLGGSPAVRRALEVYVDAILDVVDRLAALEGALATGNGVAAELDRIRLLKRSLPGRLVDAGAALRRAIDAEW